MLMHQTMRWYGPHDKVSLWDIRQAGCEGVVTALHQIPIGEIWPLDEIRKRKKMIEEAGMTWTVVESLPVSDDIKRKTGEYHTHIENYKQNLRNLAACGLKVITYNFMPVLDWLRTDIDYELPDKSTALYFNHTDFIVFDLFLLKRPGAENDYTTEAIEKARQRFLEMQPQKKSVLFSNSMLGLPGSDDSFTPEQVLTEINKYKHINSVKLKEHYFSFLKEVVPVAEEIQLKLAVHPDDPPFPVLGLPRIVSTEQDIEELLAAVPSSSNGLCFCTGSLGARGDNDVLKMMQRFGEQIHFLHLRNTKRDEEGNFFEADHLGGDTNMTAIVQEVIALQKRRNSSLPMRPDHGHLLYGDVNRKSYPGYSYIGRLRGLAELRGLEQGLLHLAEITK